MTMPNIPSFLDRRGLSATRAPVQAAAGARDRAASPDVKPPRSTPAALASAGAADFSEEKMAKKRTGPTKRQLAALAAVRAGGGMMLTLQQTEEPEVFHTCAGKKIGLATARSLIAEGLVKPNNTGLLPETGQSWVAP